jgi:hypothetical protein
MLQKKAAIKKESLYDELHFLRLQEILLRLHPPGGILNARENEYIRREWRQLARDAAKISASGCGRD